MSSDTLRPPASQDPPRHHEPLLHVKAVETGVIDVSICNEIGLITDPVDGSGMYSKDRGRAPRCHIMYQLL